jgi:hypothetical protein
VEDQTNPTEDRGDELPTVDELDRGDELEHEVADETAGDEAATADDEPVEDEIEDEPPAPAPAPKEPRIPKSRMDQAVAKERARVAALEQELNQLRGEIKKQGDAEALEAEIRELEKKHAEMMLDGKADEAIQVMSLIRAKERQIVIEESRNLSGQAKAQAREEVRLELTIERIEGDYPQLNPEHADFDEDLVDLIQSHANSLIAKGQTPSSALTKATTLIMGRLAGAPAQDDGLKRKVADRKSEQVKRNVDAMRKQPPSTNATGKDTDQHGEAALAGNIATMSEEDFDKLPEATKRRLRGDFA